MLPKRVRQASQESLNESPPLAIRPCAGDLGEVGVIRASASLDQSQGLGRFAMVAARDEANGTLLIHLATNEVEGATDLDLVVRSDDHLPFSLVVQGELYGPIFEEQLQGVAATITSKAAKAVATALASDGASLDEFQTGLPLGGANDPRRHFKEEELEELETLVSKCRAWIAGASSSVEMIDPELLLPPPSSTPLEDATDQFIELLDILAETSGTALDLPSELLSLMGEAGLIDEMSRWREEFGLDAARVLSRFTISEGQLQLPDVGTIDDKLDANRQSDVALVPFIRSHAAGGQITLDIKTTARCWDPSDDVVVISAESGAKCRTRFVKAA